MFKLLTRDQFREGVFERDRHQCVICKGPAIDAHHLIERRLWGNTGGYYLENGVSVCEKHHLEAEQTVLPVETLREAAHITKFPLPDHLYRDQVYTKWGDIVLPNGQRLKGELFHDESVQKILRQGNVLSLYSDRVKYPRTYHLPWSPGLINDDRVMESLDGFKDQEVVATVKMDGENTTIYPDGIHARSIEYHSHPSRNLVKALYGRLSSDIPTGYRLCGENLFAKHSIHYKNLDDFFLLFSIWNERNECLSWDETVEWAALLGLKTVPVLWRGVWDEAQIRKLYQAELAGDQCEGYVVRVARGFHYGDFRNVVGKYVRKGHVSTDNHWIHAPLVKNEIKPYEMNYFGRTSTMI